MQPEGTIRRTGGRSARVRSAVHAAVAELLADPAAELTIAAVADRSGVHPTSLYRRWGTLESLVLDVAVARVSAASPMPDTGTLRADLLAYAQQAAHDLAQPDGLAFLRAVLTASGTEPGDGPQRQGASDGGFLASRGEQIQAMLDRAAARGEPSLHYTEVLDVLLAPLYLRALFRVGGIDAAYLEGLVERLLTTAARQGPPQPAPHDPAAAPKPKTRRTGRAAVVTASSATARRAGPEPPCVHTPHRPDALHEHASWRATN